MNHWTEINKLMACMIKSALTSWWSQPPWHSKMCRMLQCRNTFSSASWKVKLMGIDASEETLYGPQHEAHSSEAADLAPTKKPCRMSVEGKMACEKELNWTLRSGFHMAASQKKYFSTEWIRACLLLRCNQTPLRLLGAFKELAGAGGIHLQKKKKKSPFFFFLVIGDACLLLLLRMS